MNHLDLVVHSLGIQQMSSITMYSLTFNTCHSAPRNLLWYPGYLEHSWGLIVLFFFYFWFRCLICKIISIYFKGLTLKKLCSPLCSLSMVKVIKDWKTPNGQSFQICATREHNKICGFVVYLNKNIVFNYFYFLTIQSRLRAVQKYA